MLNHGTIKSLNSAILISGLSVVIFHVAKPVHDCSLRDSTLSINVSVPVHGGIGVIMVVAVRINSGTIRILSHSGMSIIGSIIPNHGLHKVHATTG